MPCRLVTRVIARMTVSWGTCQSLPQTLTKNSEALTATSIAIDLPTELEAADRELTG
jgi:hypothetical protein